MYIRVEHGRDIIFLDHLLLLHVIGYTAFAIINEYASKQ